MVDSLIIIGLFLSSLGISFTIVSVCLHKFLRDTENKSESELKQYEKKYDLYKQKEISNGHVKPDEINYDELFFEDDTPVGKVIMKYDKETKMFEYYSDRHVSNRMLETVCRGFIIENNCYDLYVDYIEEMDKRKQVLKRVEEEKLIKEQEKEKEKEDEVENLFVSFKRYNKKKGEKLVTKNDIMIKNDYNKFKFKGKVCEFGAVSTYEDKYENISFEEFKKMN